ncbi:MAG: hypothetical protein LBQ12_16330 [Deltaproteobacteria bacterium]|nr:hypothetical protein [Deltaproteobacteria bacterium]
MPPGSGPSAARLGARRNKRKAANMTSCTTRAPRRPARVRQPSLLPSPCTASLAAAAAATAALLVVLLLALFAALLFVFAAPAVNLPPPDTPLRDARPSEIPSGDLRLPYHAAPARPCSIPLPRG